MEIIVDTSAILAVVLNELVKTKIISATAGAELMAPDSMPFEIGNAFSAMFKRNRITLDKALLAIEEYKKIPIRLVDVLMEDAVEQAHQLNIYTYDAYMITLALRRGAPLLSLDKGLKHAANLAGLSVLSI
jgi:predicted nucleic acid-binding protein